jgi:hypothetical protein
MLLGVFSLWIKSLVDNNGLSNLDDLRPESYELPTDVYIGLQHPQNIDSTLTAHEKSRNFTIIPRN